MDRIFDRETIERLEIPLDDIAKSVGEAFVAGRTGEISWRPKTMLAGVDGVFQMSTFASWPSQNLSIFHMLFGGSAAEIAKGAPNYVSRQYVIDRQLGRPYGVIDGTYTSNVLPAGVTRLLSKRLARTQSKVAVIVGAGTQARLNLEALDGILPIETVRIITRTQASATKFAKFVEQRGQTPVITEAGPAALQGADIIISTVPASRELKPFLDPSWVGPGTFVNAVDLGRSWTDGFGAFDRLIVDDRDQAEHQVADGRLSHKGPYDSEIADILSECRPGRQTDEQRIVLIHPGNVVGVLGVTKTILARLLSTSPQ